MASSTRVTLLFILPAVVVCGLPNAGNLGTIDTARRRRVARSIRLGEPMVTSDDVRQGFSTPRRNGVPHAGYGVGQSLLLLPIDALVDATAPHYFATSAWTRLVGSRSPNSASPFSCRPS